MVDCFTKYTWTKASKRKTARVVRQFVQEIFEDRPPKIFHTDNGKEFRNNQLEEWVESLSNSRLVHGAPYHPQSQGQVERLNRTIKDSLSAATEVTREYNLRFHRSLRLSPYYAEFGSLPQEEDIPHFLKEREFPPLEEIHQGIHTRLVKQASNIIEKSKGKVTQYEVNDLVLVKRENTKERKKSEPLYPFVAKIVEKFPNHLYKIAWMGTGGPNQQDKPGDHSLVSARILRPLFIRDPEINSFFEPKEK